MGQRSTAYQPQVLAFLVLKSAHAGKRVTADDLDGGVLGLDGGCGVLTLVGLAVEADLISASSNADHTALRWHAFFWDPWFLLWGLTFTAALRLSAKEPLMIQAS